MNCVWCCPWCHISTVMLHDYAHCSVVTRGNTSVRVYRRAVRTTRPGSRAAAPRRGTTFPPAARRGVVREDFTITENAT